MRTRHYAHNLSYGAIMSMILEAILTTATPDGGTHIAPLGFRRENGYIVLSPFHPSRTLDNLRATGVAAISHPPAVRVFAGCLTGRRDWPLVPCAQVACGRLADALRHSEKIVERIVVVFVFFCFFCL